MSDEILILGKKLTLASLSFNHQHHNVHKQGPRHQQSPNIHKQQERTYQKIVAAEHQKDGKALGKIHELFAALLSTLVYIQHTSKAINQ